MKTKKPKFTWKVVRVPIKKIKPTPNNFKIKTEEGLAQFNTSVEKYGRAGAVILNADFTLINGNTNIEKAKELGETHVDASMPNKKLSPKEFTEFAAMFDAIRAGQVDELRIKKELGKTADFFKTWGWEPEKNQLDALAELEKKDGKIIPTSKATEKEKPKGNETRPVTLLFTVDEAETFIKRAEALYDKYKVDNVTDLVFKVFTKKGLL